MKRTVIIALLFSVTSLMAQKHLSPPSGADGVPGRIPGSFAIEWEAVEGAIAYEFVLTDNSDCFAGCAGDTRQAQITDTRTIQFGLQEGLFYYWITRVFYDNGDVSGWSPVSSFRAVTAEIDEVLRLASPVVEQTVLWIDWQAITDVPQIQLSMIDMAGRQVRPAPLADIWTGLRPRNGFERFSRYEIPLTGLRPGVYVFVFSLQRAEESELLFRKIVVE